MSGLDLHKMVGKDLTTESIRKGFGEGLVAAGDENSDVVALCADLTESTQMHLFAEKFPERFVEIGIAEQNLVTVGSGMAATGKIPFVSSYAAFSPGRNWEQIRTTIALNNQPVKIIGSHGGLYTGADGATHQMLEDYALMRVLPNMVVIAPCDYQEAKKAIVAMAKDKRPNYIRITREKTPVFTDEKTPFQIGKAFVFTPGADISIISTGAVTYQALKAADSLFKDGIDAEVIHVSTIKPLDTITILNSAKKTGRVITVEEHQINGGLGGAVSEFLGEHFPVPIKRIGVKDRFGESGTPDELLEYLGVNHKSIAVAAHHMLSGENNL